MPIANLRDQIVAKLLALEERAKAHYRLRDDEFRALTEIIKQVVDEVLSLEERLAVIEGTKSGDLGNRQRESAPPAYRSEFANSSNGDRWFLSRERDTGTPYVVHVANDPSGGAVTRIDVPGFLNRSADSPEQQALLRLIGTLVEKMI